MSSSNNMMKSISDISDTFTNTNNNNNQAFSFANSGQQTSPIINTNYFTWRFWLLIIFVLLFFGINVFLYLAKGSQEIMDLFERIFGPILHIFGITTLGTIKQTIETSAEGTRDLTNIIEDTTVGTINKLENVPTNTQINTGVNKLQNALLDTTKLQESVLADDANSTIQTGKSGWCFIGQDQGLRSCAEVGVNDTCMSGNIYPTKDICINPNLRQ